MLARDAISPAVVDTGRERGALALDRANDANLLTGRIASRHYLLHQHAGALDDSR
jgi:hypothetical protein